MDIITEEQFYLIWPPLLILLRGLRARSHALGIAGGVAVTVLALSSIYFLEALFGFHTYLRATGLVVGCALAFVLSRTRPRAPKWLGIVSLALLSLSVFAPFTFPGELLPNG